MNTGKVSYLVRRALRKTGFDLVRFRSLNTVFANRGITLVFDVGANIGQYAQSLRELDYRGKIVSFEPLKRTFDQLAATAATDPAWTPVNLGLGSAPCEKQINLYEDPCLNSVLPLDQQTYPTKIASLGTETIRIETLDGIFNQYVSDKDRAFLKIDTQGYEKEVLQGAAQSLSQLAGIQIELSLTPIYAGQPSMDEMIVLMREKGFALWKITRGMSDVHTGREYEVDGIFINENPAAV